MWDSMIEKVKKEIYQWEGKEPDEVSDFYSVIVLVHVQSSIHHYLAIHFFMFM
jgi:hypothetical protein